jgi:hypothetical protein
MRAMLSGSMSGSFAHLVGPKSEEKQDKDDYTCQGHPMEYWDNGHMTNYQKWTKMKVVALTLQTATNMKGHICVNIGTKN